MPTTIDAAGRLVIPKAVREAAGIRAGMSLEVRYRDGRVEIEPSPVEIEVTLRDGVAVARAREHVPTLSTDAVEGTRDKLREGRDA